MRRPPRLFRNRLLTLTFAALVTVPLTAAPAAGAEPPDPPPASTATADPAGVPLPGLASKSYTITLITGDKVALTPGPGGRFSIDAEPAPRPDGSVPELYYTNLGRRDAMYVLSEDVFAHIQSGRVDRELFNVAYLAAHGYADADAERMPVIVEYDGEQDAKTLRAKPDTLAATGDVTVLESISAAATTVDKTKAAAFWKSLVGDRPAVRSLAGGAERLWLDPKVEVTLEDSVPQVGAPQAWQAGLDGTGVKVAVLDTGIDETHPDLAGKVTAAKSFIPDQEVRDGHGHGTHVAATLAGSGAASDGRRKGVAPGVELIVGKVLADDGFSTGSFVIEGMEWAASEMDADVVSMSLGSSPTDGTDPLSQAVNNLTESTGALFVVAAGNSGRKRAIAAPGAATAALTVGAVDKSDKLAAFSSRGPRLGDHAIKPDITAPGAAIVAARAAGTAAGSPVDEWYTAINGTSMATPHVAGGAAILAQRYPDWGPAQLKAALMAGARDGGMTAYQQGAGRLDIAQAVRQQIQVSPSAADFGFVRLPGGPDPLTKTLTYTNPGDQPVTLTLRASARTEDGEPVPDGALTLSTDTVTVPAGGSAEVSVTLDHRDLAADTYTGSVVAATADGAVRLTTPVGLILGKRLHKLTVRMIHSGNPRGWHKDHIVSPPVIIAPLEGAETQNDDWITIGGSGRPVVDYDKGVEVMVPEGTHVVFTANPQTWLDPSGEHQEAWLIDPEVVVPRDTEVVLDAGKAVRVTYDTPRPSQGHTRQFAMLRWEPDDVANRGFFASWGQITLTTNARRDNFWVTPTERVTRGEFTFAVQTVRTAPVLTMTLDGDRPIPLRAQYPVFGAALGGSASAPDPSAMFSGRHRLPLVDVGFGGPEELAAVDVEGKIAMIRRDPADLKSIFEEECWPTEQAFRALIDAGAAAIVVGQNEYRDYPGPAIHFMRCDVPSLTGLLAPARFLRTMVNELPIVFVPFADADLLRKRAAAGDVYITVEGNPRTPYYYQVKPYEEGRIPKRLHYTLRHGDLATVEHELHAPEQTWRAMTMAAWRPYEPAIAEARGAQALPPFAPAPWKVTEYVGPVARDTIVRHSVGEPGLSGPRQMHFGTFPAKRRTSIVWHDSPSVPSVAPPLIGKLPKGYPGPLYIPDDVGLCTGCREGDRFWPSLRYSASADPDQIGQDDRFAFGQWINDDGISLQREDGTVIPPTADPYGAQLLGYDLPPEPARYRLTHKFDDTETTWTFTSGKVTEHQTTDDYLCTGAWLEDWANLPATGAPCRPEPLIFLRYDFGLDPANQIAAGRLHRFEVTAHRQPGKAPAPAVTGLTLQVSYDGGASWTAAKIRPLRDGRFSAELRHPAAATGPVTIKAEAWDAAGNRVSQTLADAFTLKKN